jgi:WD40 repeat protein
MIRLFLFLLSTALAVVASPPVIAQESTPAAAAPIAAGIAVAKLDRDSPVDFEKEILPFLKNNCLACHNTTKGKGGLNLETPQHILKGGDTGPAAVPGKSAESLIFKASAHLDSELIMPPKDNKANASALTSDQLALLKLWIDQGAKGEVRAAAPVNWLEQPPALDPIFAVALTADGQFAACGRGNRIDVYHVPSGRLLAPLADAALTHAGLTNTAHRDLVNALSFHPDGTLLASAGFREVKLWRRPTGVQKRAVALTNAARLLALSPDHKWLAAAGSDHAIALYDFATGHLVRTLSGQSNEISALRFSPAGTRLCAASADKTIRVWSILDGKLDALAEVTAQINAVAWLSGGRQIAAGCADGLVRVFNMTNDPPALMPVREFKAHEGAVMAIEVNPVGQEIFSAGADGFVRQWKPEAEKPVRELKHDGLVGAVAVRPDGRRIASASTNGIAKLWNAEDGKLVAEMKGDRYADELAADTERALIVAKRTTEFHEKALESAEGGSKKQQARVATAIATNTFTEKVFLEKEKAFKEAQTAKAGFEKALNELLTEIQRVTENFEKADRDAREAAARAKLAAAKAGDTQLAAERAALSRTDAEKIAADMAGVATRTKAAVNNADAAKETARRIAEESAAVAEKSKGFAAAVVADAEMKNKLAVEAKAVAEAAIERVATLSFAAGQLKPGYDKTLADAPEKRKQATNQIESATKTLVSAEKEFKRAETRKSVTGHELELALGAAARASNTVAEAKATLETAANDQRRTDGEVNRLKKESAAAVRPIRALSFSPDGLTLATFGEDRRVHTWSGETGVAFDVYPDRQAMKTANAPETEVPYAGAYEVEFIDAQTVLVPADRSALVAWDLNPNWTLERSIGTGDIDSPLSDRVNALRFSPDGLTLATGSGEPTRSGEIKLWNVADGKFKREFGDVHSDAVLALDFSPDGKYLASSSADRFVRVIDLKEGKVAKAFEGHTSYVLGVAWKSDSRTLASAGADNVVKVWDMVTGDRKKNIDGASKEVTSVAWVGVTDQAVVASGDNQVRLVRENGEKVRSFEGAADFMNAVAATPDGGTVVAGGQDGVLRVWNGRDGKAIASFDPRPAK